MTDDHIHLSDACRLGEPCGGVSRRALLRGLGATGAVLIGGSLLAGCAATSVNRGQVGEPIPDGRRRTRVDRGEPLRRPYEPSEPVTPAYRLPPGVIGRDRWAAFGPNYQKANPMSRIRRITVHHDGMGPFTSTDMMATKQRLESIRKAHLGQGWADIGYHYVVDPAGRVWEARPTSLQGAHVRDENDGNLGIMVLGNYERQRPTGQATASLEAFIIQQRQQYGVPVSAVYTHQELRATACPGRSLQAFLDSSRSGTGRIARS